MSHAAGSLGDMDTDPPFLVVAPGHPSLDGAVAEFCDELRAETRWFGRRAARAPKPFPRLVERLAAASGIRLAAVHDGAVIGLAGIADDVGGGAELIVAVPRRVARARRGAGARAPGRRPGARRRRAARS